MFSITKFSRGSTGELNVDGTEITAFHGSVPLPRFFIPYENNAGELESFSQLCFLAQVSLRTIVDRIVDSQKVYRKLLPKSCFTILNNLGNLFDNDHNDGKDEFPSQFVTDQLIRNLDSWRQHLPQQLSWDDDQAEKPSSETIRNGGWQNIVVNNPQEIPDMKLVLMAALQTRYKYAQYMIWRPYIYRYLHFPNSLKDHDLEGCRKGLNVRYHINSFSILTNVGRLV